MAVQLNQHNQDLGELSHLMILYGYYLSIPSLNGGLANLGW